MFKMTILEKNGEAKSYNQGYSVIQITKEGLKQKIELITTTGEKIELKVKQNTRVIFM